MKLYSDYINEGLERKKLHHFHTALSREANNKQYVQDLLKRDSETVAYVEKGAVFMICGL